MRVGHVIVLHEYDLEQILGLLVGVDHFAYLAQQLDDSFCAAVARCGLCAEDEGGRGEVLDAAVLYAVVDVDYRQGIEQLALVLVKPFYLDIENGTRVNVDTVVGFDEVGKLLLFGFLDIDELAQDGFVICILGKLFEPVKVGYPGIVTEQPCDERGKLLVAKREPAALCDAVGLVLKSFGVQVVPRLEGIGLEYLGVYLRNAVDKGRNVDSHICHIHHAI